MNIEEGVLAALFRGARTVGDVADALNIGEEDAERILRRLELEGLVKCSEKGWWIFKKLECRLTEKGFEKASKAFEKLVELAKEVRRKVEEGGKAALAELPPTTLTLLPLLAYLGLIDPAIVAFAIASREILPETPEQHESEEVGEEEGEYEEESKVEDYETEATEEEIESEDFGEDEFDTDFGV